MFERAGITVTLEECEEDGYFAGVSRKGKALALLEAKAISVILRCDPLKVVHQAEERQLAVTQWEDILKENYKSRI